MARATFNLTVGAAPPTVTGQNILNAASFYPGVSPGSIAYIRLPGIAPNIRGSVTPNSVVGPLPTTLAGVQVTVNGVAAPIFAVSNVNSEESVIIQVPFETPVGTGAATFTVTSPGGTATATGVDIAPVKPGVFTYTDPGSNQVYAVATRPDGSYISSSNPARRGEVVRIYATGLGQTTPATATNRTGIPGESVAAGLVVGVNNSGTRLVSSELMEGTIGVYVIALEIPADTQTGPNQPLGLGVDRGDGGIEFSNSTFIPIQ